MSKRKAKHNVNRNIGSVSSGTMLASDLIPSFLWELKRQSPIRRSHLKLIREIEKQIETNPDYFDSEEASWDFNEGLFDALQEYAPAYFYFGAHPDDAADYGWWLSEDFENEFDGLKVSDTSEVPRNYTGEVLLVNDHGNMTLYYYSRGRGRRIWGNRMKHEVKKWKHP